MLGCAIQAGRLEEDMGERVPMGLLTVSTCEASLQVRKASMLKHAAKLRQKIPMKKHS